MARSVTVQSIVDMVQILVEDPSHKLASETDYIRRIDRTAARLYRFYVEAEPDRFRTEATITAGTGIVVGTVASYALPAAWLSTIGVDYANGSQREQLDRLQEEERNDYVGQTGTSRAFRLVGSSNITLYATPVVGQTYIHIYMPTAPDLTVAIAPALTALTNTIDCRLGHEDWIEKCVARDLLKMKNEYAGQWDSDIDKIEAELKVEANWRYFTDVVTMAQKRSRRPWPYGPGNDLMLPRLPRP